MKKQHSFNDFEYRSSYSPLSNKKCVEVSFNYDGKKAKRYIFTDGKDSAECIDKAKKIINKELKSGKLINASNKFIKGHHFPLKPILIALASVVAAGGLSASGYFVYKHLTSGGGTPGPGPQPEPVSTYTVTFKNENKVVKELKDITAGHIIDDSELPTRPIKEGYNFTGWCTDEAGKNIFEYSKIAIHQNYTLYAGWEKIDPTTALTITFYNDTTKVSEITNIAPGTIVTKQTEGYPNDPTKSGYNFTGWCTDEAGKNIFDFSKVKIYQDYTLYAGWEAIQPTPTDTYLVDFNGAGCNATIEGKAFTSDIFDDGEEVELTISPLTDHYDLNETISVKINGNEATLGEDYTYTPISDTKNYKLAFEVKGRTDINAGTTEYCFLTYDCSLAEQEIPPERIKKGELLGESRLEPKQVENYTFYGWYQDDDFKYECTPNQKILEDMTIYGLYHRGDINKPLTFTCIDAGEDGKSSSIKILAYNRTQQNFQRNLKYRIIRNDGQTTSWAHIKDADSSGNFTIYPGEGWGWGYEILNDEEVLFEGDSIQFAGDNEIFSCSTEGGNMYLVFLTGFGADIQEDFDDKFSLSGNIKSLISFNDFSNPNVKLTESCFSGLFTRDTFDVEEPCCNIANAKYLALHDEDLKANCYSGMFENSNYLEIAPELCATVLVDGCYDEMFIGCTNLKELKVDFGTKDSDVWPTASDCTNNWLNSAGIYAMEEPTFYWKGVSDPERTIIPDDGSHVPGGWQVVSY